MQRLATFLVSVLWAVVVPADDADVGHDVYGKGKWAPQEAEELPAWKEGGTRIPDYPQDKNLLPFQVDGLDRPYQYFVDGASLSTGDDQVVRYTVVIESPSGARNVLHEGIHCDKKAYKTYAFGSSDGTFRRTKNSQWKLWYGSGVFGYRSQLAREYLCNNLGFPYRDKERLVRFKQGGQSAFNPHGESWANPGFQ